METQATQATQATQSGVQTCADKFPNTKIGENAAAKNLMTTVGVSHRKGNCGDVLWASLTECAKACIINNTDDTRKVFNNLLSEYNSL